MNAALNHATWKEREAYRETSAAYDVQELTREGLNELIGRNTCRRARKQAREASHYQAARNLKKAGFGLLFARLILLGRG